MDRRLNQISPFISWTIHNVPVYLHLKYYKTTPFHHWKYNKISLTVYHPCYSTALSDVPTPLFHRYIHRLNGLIRLERYFDYNHYNWHNYYHCYFSVINRELLQLAQLLSMLNHVSYHRFYYNWHNCYPCYIKFNCYSLLLTMDSTAWAFSGYYVSAIFISVFHQFSTSLTGLPIWNGRGDSMGKWYSSTTSHYFSGNYRHFKLVESPDSGYNVWGMNGHRARGMNGEVFPLNI